MRKYFVLMLFGLLFFSACQPDLSDERIKKDSMGALDVCANSPDKEQGDCYNKIAFVLATTDVELALKACSSIKDEESKNRCYQDLLIAQNDTAIKFDICKKIDIPDLNVKCLQDISQLVQKTDPNFAILVCSELPDPDGSERTPRGDCIQQIISAQNGTELKLAICKKVEKEDWKKTCIENLANEEKDPVKAMALCNEITNDNNFREHCYGGINANNQDLSTEVKLLMCDAKTGTDKDRCYQSSAEELFETDPLESVEICNKITDKNTKDNCMNNFMSSPELVKANPNIALDICDVASLVTKSRCYSDLARTLSGSDSKKAVEICQRLSDDVQISDCYNNVWFFSNELVAQNYDFTVNMCNLLTLKKDDCLNRMVGVFIDLDRSKAEAICKLMSASSSSGCLNEVKR